MCSILKLSYIFKPTIFGFCFVLLKLLSNQSIKSLVYAIAQMLITKLYEHVKFVKLIYELFRTTRTIKMRL